MWLVGTRVFPWGNWNRVLEGSRLPSKVVSSSRLAPRALAGRWRNQQPVISRQ